MSFLHPFLPRCTRTLLPLLRDIDRRAETLVAEAAIRNNPRDTRTADVEGGGFVSRPRLTQFVRGVAVNEGNLGAEYVII